MNKFRIKEFARKINRSTSTVRRWEREGLIVSKRMPSGHRYFDDSDVAKIMGIDASSDDFKSTDDRLDELEDKILGVYDKLEDQLIAILKAMGKTQKEIKEIIKNVD